MNQLIIIYCYSVPNRKVLEDCYTKNTIVDFTKNLMQFVVHLDSAHNPECEVLPIGVAANLSFNSPSFNNISILTVDFSYNRTTELLFKIPYTLSDTQLDELESEIGVYLTIYSFSELLTVELLIFEETLSSLQDCFTSLYTYLQFDSIILQFFSSNQCKSQMQLEVDSPDSFISQISLQIGSFRFELDPLVLIPLYSQPEFNISLNFVTENEIKVVTTLQTEKFPSGFVTFESNQGGQLVDFIFEIDQFAFQTVNAVQNVDLSCFQDSFFATVNQFDVQQLNSLSGYTHWEYKLSFQVTEHEIVEFPMLFQEKFNKQQYENIIQFDCEVLLEALRDSCYKLYKMQKFGQVIFSVEFYNGHYLHTHSKTHATFKPSQISQAIVKVSKTQICVETDNNVPTNSAQLQINNTVYNNNINKNSTIFCFACNKCSADKGFYILHTDSDNIITNLVFKNDYVEIKSVSISIGLTILFISIIIAIRSIIQTQQLLAKLKKKKRTTTE
ncbi:Conserved_hypothetical protein [Hexamita inflata]|uniref:Transmembrane protein n=1 Tax=Hexamita inflata TaxID=28002 RepID=A0AA86P806_9EUKA|nr:Conserved hypothetical protein [Hexamita inflata]